jgi:demethylmenaquinone methyltransferase/2-methoxy-6-polyprenyl-1,4-benzoquinol methylase
MTQLQGEAKQRYVANLFARISRRYDLMNTLMTGGMHHRWKRYTARITARGLSGKALDIATGTGDLAIELVRRPEVEHAVGVDLLPEMLALARAKARSRRLDDQVTLIAGDALSLPFPDGVFACATAGFSLRNMPDLPRALTEMTRVVRPGGRVTTLELTPLNSGFRSRLFRVYFHRLVPLMGQIIAGDRSAYTYLPQSVDHFLEADRLRDLFRQVGLIDVGHHMLGFGTVAIHYGVKPEVPEPG